jgi:hypothetical protein
MIKSGGYFFYKGKRCIIGAVKSILKDFDLALIELPPDCMVEITKFGSAVVLDDALLANDMHVIASREGNRAYILGDAEQLHGNCDLI